MLQHGSKQRSVLREVRTEPGRVQGERERAMLENPHLIQCKSWSRFLQWGFTMALLGSGSMLFLLLLFGHSVSTWYFFFKLCHPVVDSRGHINKNIKKLRWLFLIFVLKPCHHTSKQRIGTWFINVLLVFKHTRWISTILNNALA